MIITEVGNSENNFYQYRLSQVAIL